MDSQRMVKVNACVLQTLPGLERLGLSLFEGKTMRQLGRGQEDDEGNDISGFFVVADGGAAVIFNTAKDGRQWANNKNQVNIEIAPSLTYVDSGNPHGGKLAVVNSTDLIKLLMTHPKMKALTAEAAMAFVQRETGAVAGLARAVQAATAPTAGQRMLQAGFRGALADGASREESSTHTDASGQQVAQRLVERGVVLPGGQGVHVQLAQQAVVCESELGKRKYDEALTPFEMMKRDLEFEEQKITCETRKLDNTQKKMDMVIKFTDVMSFLDAKWRDDRRVVLQTQDCLKNALFGNSAILCAQNPAANAGEAHAVAVAVEPPALASISISQVATEMGVRLAPGQAIAIGKLVSKAYQNTYGSPPSKHNQFVDGAVRSVNSYTEEHRVLIAAAVRALVR